MQINRMLHAALLVRDLDRAKAFYGGVLGLIEKPRHRFTYPGAWYDLGGCELHLMVTEARLAPPDDRPQRDAHIAFQVDDLEAVKREIEAAGLSYREGRSGLAQIFLRDPDGNLLELQAGKSD